MCCAHTPLMAYHFIEIQHCSMACNLSRWVISKHHFRVHLAPVKHNMPRALHLLFLLHGTLPSDVPTGDGNEAVPDVTVELGMILVIGLQVKAPLFTNRSKVNAVMTSHKAGAETQLLLPVDS